MSQEGLVDIIGTHPTIPVEFVADSGTAVPIANVLELLGSVVAAGTHPFRSVASGNTVTYQVQIAQAIAATDATKIGLSNYDSAYFSVDANGFVSLTSGGLGVLSVSGTLNRITSTGGANPVIDISASYVGQTSITTLGTITTGVWNGTAIAATFGGTGQTTYATGDILYASAANTLSKLPASTDGFTLILSGGVPIWAASPAAGVDSVTGTLNRITISGTASDPIIDIAATYVGQTSITTLGTVTTGTWNASVIGLTYGGTNANLTASNGGIFYSTATAGAILSGTATANKVLMSGATAAPVWSTPTYPNASATAGKVIVSDGTNYVASTPTFPNASATSGKFMQSDGTNWVASTPTLPTTAGTSGKILISDGTNIVSSTPTYPNSATGTGTLLRADGTNWVATTTTYPNTNAINTLLYASAANVMSALATANTAILATNGSGVPSLTTTPACTSITLSGGTALDTYTSGGTWTPAIQFGGASVGITYAARSASYSRIGNIVTFTLSIELSNKGSSTGAATITGLPFNPASTTIWAISANALTFSGMVNARNPSGVSTISLDNWASAGSRSVLTDTAFSNSTFVQISGSYLV